MKHETIICPICMNHLAYARDKEIGYHCDECAEHVQRAHVELLRAGFTRCIPESEKKRTRRP